MKSVAFLFVFKLFSLFTSFLAFSNCPCTTKSISQILSTSEHGIMHKQLHGIPPSPLQSAVPAFLSVIPVFLLKTH